MSRSHGNIDNVASLLRHSARCVTRFCNLNLWSLSSKIKLQNRFILEKSVFRNSYQTSKRKFVSRDAWDLLNAGIAGQNPGGIIQRFTTIFWLTLNSSRYLR